MPNQDASTKGYIFFLRQAIGTTNAANDGLNEDQVNLGSEVNSTVLVSGATAATAFSPYNNNQLGALAIDPHNQKYFYVNQVGGGSGLNAVDYPVIYAGSTVTGQPNPTVLYDPINPSYATTTNGVSNAITGYDYQAGGTILINDIAVDQANNRLYFTRQYEVPVTSTRGIDKPVKASSGLYYVPEAGGKAVTVATGLSNPGAIALDLVHGFAFVTDSTGVGYSGDQANAVNRIVAINLGTGAVSGALASAAYHPDAVFGTDSYGGSVFDGVAVDPATSTLYWTTGNGFNNLTTDAYADTNTGIYKATYTISGGVVSLGAVTTLYSGAGTHDPGRISIDTANGVFYVVGNTPNGTNGGTDWAVWEGSLGSVNGTALTRVTPASETTPSDGTQETLGTTTFDVPGAANVALDVVPTVTAGSTVTYVTTGGAVAADAGLRTGSTTSAFYNSGSVSISAGFLSGDTLAATTTGTGITASYNTGSGVLTLSGSDTTAHYQQVLDSVTFQTSNGNPTSGGTDKSRTLTYSVFDGIATGTGTSTVNIEAAPIVAAGNPSVTFTGGGAAVTADPALTITSTSTSTLAGATIRVTAGFLAGDTLGFASQNGITGSYNGSTGVLTLSGSASAASYQAAIRSVTFGFSPGNGNPTAGNDTSRTLSYTVTDGTVASTAVTSTVSVVHAPPGVSAGGTVIYARAGNAVAVAPGLTVSAPDSGGTLASASVSIGAGFMAGDVLAFTSQNGITGSYNTGTGMLTLNGTATAAQYQAALDSVTFTSTQPGTGTGNRTIRYLVNDGTANSAAGTSTVTVAVPTPTISGAAANQAVSDAGTVQPFLGVTVGDAAGETVSATITLSAGGTATDADGLLSGAGLTKTGAGTYSIAGGTAGALTSTLKALTFTPTAHQVAPGSAVTTTFTVAVADAGGGSASNGATTVVATAALDAPVITGTTQGVQTTDLVPVKPFGAVTITDPDVGATPTVTITLRAGGVATDANGTLAGMGLTRTGTGTYTLAAAVPATLTNRLRALVFTPTPDQVPVGSTVTTEFDLLASFGSASAADTTTTVVATDVPCFCAGTRIATPGGEAAVEALAAGDLVLTASGAVRPIRWIGQRSYAGRFLRANREVWPIRIQAGALAENVPARDLWVSPLHALFLDGLLIPAGTLLDGVAITRERVEAVHYFHVELDSHDVLLADGAPAESFVDDDSCAMFHNAASRPGGAAGTAAAFCAPRVTHGFGLEAIRTRIASRARMHAAGRVPSGTATSGAACLHG